MADIKDTEIRFIRNDEPSHAAPQPMQQLDKQSRKHKQGCRRYVWYGVLFLVLIGLLAVLGVRSCSMAEPVVWDGPGSYDAFDEDTLFYLNRSVNEQSVEGQFEQQADNPDADEVNRRLSVEPAATGDAYCEMREMTINDIGINIYIPINATPDFRVGKISSNDATIVLAMQAADIRKDNGEIVGAAVNDGEVVGKGLSKLGYVAIIGGKITIGVTNHSPLFEEAVVQGGDFFRQYPLVSDGRIVENVIQNLSIRRALCVRSGQIFAVETKVPVSFHDFSQMLVDFGVGNAVYLVGSEYACGFCRDAKQTLKEWGVQRYSRAKNVSYLVWRKNN